MTLPSTLRHGNTASCWNTKPTRRSTPSTGASNSVTLPACGFAMPAISPSVVDLPQPVGPTTAQNSPGAMVRSNSSSAERTLPSGVTNRRATFFRAMAEGIIASMLMRRVGLDDELRGVGFRQIDGLALHVGGEARQHLQHRFRRALGHHAVGRILRLALAQALHIELQLAGVIILRHLRRDF